MVISIVLSMTKILFNTNSNHKMTMVISMAKFSFNSNNKDKMATSKLRPFINFVFFFTKSIKINIFIIDILRNRYLCILK